MARSPGEACGTACAECEEDQRCARCVNIGAWSSRLPARGFALDKAQGVCVLPFEQALDRIGYTLLALLVVVIISAVAMHLLVVVFKGKNKKQAHALHTARPDRPTDKASLLDKLEEADDTMPAQERLQRSRVSIAHGLASWLQRQMRDWELKGHAKPERYPCNTNVSKAFIMGVGLPLFYGFQWLLISSAGVAAVVLLVAQRVSRLEDAYTPYDDATDVHLDEEVVMPALSVYAQNMFYALGLLYVLLLGMSYRHANYQRQFKQYFDMQSSCMADFTLHLEGLPSNATNEGALKDIVERQLDCAGQVIGISIGYDMTIPDVSGPLFNMWEHLIVRCDTQFRKEGSPLVADGWGYDEDIARPEHLNEKADRDQFCKLWRDGKLRGGGHAFIVFKHKSFTDKVALTYQGMWVQHSILLKEQKDVDAIRNALGGTCRASAVEAVMSLTASRPDLTVNPGQARQAPEMPSCARLNKRIVLGRERLEEGTRVLNVDDLKVGGNVQLERFVKVVNDPLEPTSTEFWNFGTTMEDRAVAGRQVVLLVVAFFMVIVVLVYFPLFYWLNNPYALVQGSPGMMASQLQGIIMGITGNVLGVLVWIKVCTIGHYCKADRDMYFVRFSTFTNTFNTFFFLGTGLYAFIENGFIQLDMSPGAGNRAKAISDELTLWHSFYWTLIPGSLFSGVITGKLMGWFMPVLQNYAVTQIVYVARCLPKAVNEVIAKVLIPWGPQADWLSAREAEHIFEPPEVALAWEYGQYIYTPAVCCMGLFVVAPNSWKIFAVLALWTVFMYLLHRHPTLQISKKQMSSGAQLQALVEQLWGIPLALVLAACGFWGVRCNKLGDAKAMASYWIVLFLFVLGLLTHSWLLMTLPDYDRPCFDADDVPYEDVVRKLRYTWFNVNPVHVLKSKFCPEALGDKPNPLVEATVPFEYGKEYLQLLAGRKT